MWYNVENFFDTINNPSTNDDEFTPNGKLNWNSIKYQSKINNIAKVLKAQSNNFSDFMGFCEIENKSVLIDLFNKLSLNYDYTIVHYDSPDERGIDVGFAFNHKKWNLIQSKPIPVQFISQPQDKTRDLLYVQCQSIDNKDTINFILAHFPSRSGGAKASENKRIDAAKACINWMSKIGKAKEWIIMGDFNDQPWDFSLSKTLNAHSVNSKFETNLYNLMWNNNTNLASYNYQGKWEKLDQFIISNALTKKYDLKYIQENINVYKPNWLLKKSKKGSLVPFRNFEGIKWNNGYSDHLPIVIKIK